MAIKAAINGTGRIGMIVAKIITERDDIGLLAINKTAKPGMTTSGGYSSRLVDMCVFVGNK